MVIDLNTEDEAQNRHRFEAELEFIQCLANPEYLYFLAQSDYFKDEAFIKYLKYLQYWKRSEYAKYLQFPQCITILDYIVEDKLFREKLHTREGIEMLKFQQGTSWIYIELSQDDFEAI